MAWCASYGMTVLGRLGAADDVLKAVVSAPGATDVTIQDSVARLIWARSFQRIKPTQPFHGAEQSIPRPDEKQLHALDADEPALLFSIDQDGAAQIYLVRRLPSGAWLYVATQLDVAVGWRDRVRFGCRAAGA